MQMPQAVTVGSDAWIMPLIRSSLAIASPSVDTTALSSEWSKDAMRRPRAAWVATRLLPGQHDDINATEWYSM